MSRLWRIYVTVTIFDPSSSSIRGGEERVSSIRGSGRSSKDYWSSSPLVNFIIICYCCFHYSSASSYFHFSPSPFSCGQPLPPTSSSFHYSRTPRDAPAFVECQERSKHNFLLKMFDNFKRKRRLLLECVN